MSIDSAQKLAAPTLHLNGSGFAHLHRANGEVKAALGVALDKLAAAAPNGRDYYVQDDGAFERARTQHEDRVARVRSVMDEIDSILLSLCMQRMA